MATIAEERQVGRLPALFNFLLRPVRTWKEVDRGILRGWWALALLILVVIGAKTYAQTFSEAQVFYQIQLYAYELSPEKERVFMPPPEFIMAPPVTVIIRTAGRVGNTIVAWLAWSAALTLILSFMGRKPSSFGDLLKLVIWAWTPILLRSLIQTGYMLMTKQAIFNQGLSGLIWDQRPEPPPMLMGLPGRPIHYPTQREMALAGFLGRIDLYTVWHLLLMALGLSGYAQTPRRKTLIAVALTAIALAALATVPTLFGHALGRFRFF
jgi:hypothetical protein